MELALILERDLTSHRPVAGTITDIHVCQRQDGKWHINIRVSWKGSVLFHVGLYDKKRIRLYAKVSSAIRHIVMVYDYDGTIAVHPHSGTRDTTRF